MARPLLTQPLWEPPRGPTPPRFRVGRPTPTRSPWPTSGPSCSPSSRAPADLTLRCISGLARVPGWGQLPATPPSSVIAQHWPRRASSLLTSGFEAAERRLNRLSKGTVPWDSPCISRRLPHCSGSTSSATGRRGQSVPLGSLPDRRRRLSLVSGASAQLGSDFQGVDEALESAGVRGVAVRPALETDALVEAVGRGH